jgi:hypothetical protein
LLHNDNGWHCSGATQRGRVATQRRAPRLQRPLGVQLACCYPEGGQLCPARLRLRCGQSRPATDSQGSHAPGGCCCLSPMHTTRAASAAACAVPALHTGCPLGLSALTSASTAANHPLCWPEATPSRAPTTSLSRWRVPTEAWAPATGGWQRVCFLVGL